MVGVMMRGTDETSGSLFSYVDLEERIPARHPLRKIRQVVNDARARLDAEFEALYADFGRPSIAPERLIRASLLQILFSVRSERQLMEQLQYNLLFRWFVGLAIEDTVWNHSVFSKNRDRLIEHDAVPEVPSTHTATRLAVSDGLGIGGEPDSLLSLRNIEPRVDALEDRHEEAAGTELLRPTRDQGRWADNECPQRQRRILQKPDGLKGLAETHVVCQEAPTAHSGILRLPL
jgi:transposase